LRNLLEFNSKKSADVGVSCMQDMQDVHRLLVTRPGGPPPPGGSGLTGAAIGGIVAAIVLLLIAGAIIAWRCLRKRPGFFQKKESNEEVCTKLICSSRVSANLFAPFINSNKLPFAEASAIVQHKMLFFAFQMREHL
jgi:hypothetical protein